MSRVLEHGISNLGGDFGASRDADETTTQGRLAMADFFNADASEISFGQNMTSITFAVSRALARSWRSGDAIVVTSLDHDANFTPWVRAAEEAGVEVRIAHFDPATGELDPGEIARLLDDRVRLVTTCVASNAIGTLVDVGTITELAHDAGAIVYLDAVHAGPHHLVDVRVIDCDFLVASSYKFFGPHTGILYGKLDRLAELDFYKVRPAPSDPPDKLETGTQSFESIAGVTAAVDYLAGLGDGPNRRSSLVDGYTRIRAHERALSTRFIDGIAGLDRVTVHGVPGVDDRRVSTFALSVDGISAEAVAARFCPIKACTCGPAITTPSMPSSVSASSRTAAWFASGSSTTTPQTRSIGRWRLSLRCECQSPPISRSAINPRTRRSSSSRIARTSPIVLPSGSSSSQSM